MFYNVEFTNYLHHIEPYVLKVTWEGEWFSGHLQIVNMAHVVIQNDFSSLLLSCTKMQQLAMSGLGRIATCAGPSDLCQDSKITIIW